MYSTGSGPQNVNYLILIKELKFLLEMVDFLLDKSILEKINFIY
jgi:hypothetical protein